MLCFVMALKSKRIANDWARTSRLCEAAVRSALNQTDPDLRIILVCHEPPDWGISNADSRLELRMVDFPLPEPKKTMVDKWTKLQWGLVRASELRPDFVMLMDADDLVSNRLVQFAHGQRNANGWIFRRGYQYQYGSRWIEAKDGTFNCGTNAIVGAHLIQFPIDIGKECRERCSILRWGHTVIAEELAKAGTPLAALPFRGGIYLVGHGDNDSDLVYGTGQWLKGWRQWARQLPRMRWCSAGIRREFGIDHIYPKCSEGSR
jgi:hypothetical protein